MCDDAHAGDDDCAEEAVYDEDDHYVKEVETKTSIPQDCTYYQPYYPNLLVMSLQKPEQFRRLFTVSREGTTGVGIEWQLDAIFVEIICRIGVNAYRPAGADATVLILPHSVPVRLYAGPYQEQIPVPAFGGDWAALDVLVVRDKETMEEVCVISLSGRGRVSPQCFLHLSLECVRL